MSIVEEQTRYIIANQTTNVGDVRKLFRLILVDRKVEKRNIYKEKSIKRLPAAHMIEILKYVQNTRRFT